MKNSPNTSTLPRRHEVSAGGFVLSADGTNRVALIGRQRRGGSLQWSIPKGHPEGGESMELAAVREVAEETGIAAEVVRPLGEIEYEFYAGTRIIVKKVHHFVLRQVGGDLTVENDPNREAVTAEWVGIGELETRLEHENEKRMARALVAYLNEA